MKYGAKMALMTTMARMDEPSAGTHMPPYANDNGGMRNGYAEGAFRDNRGRRHYDNGRFAPKSEMDGRAEMNGGYTAGFVRREVEDDYRPMGRVLGFAGGYEADQNYRMDAGYSMTNEMDHRSGKMEHGHGKSSGGPSLSKELAESWVENMKHANGGSGEKWTLDHVKQILARKGITSDPIQYWVAMNALYSDYCSVFAKAGVGDSVDFYVDLAKAFINDSDAQPDKLARYYEYVVKH